AKGDPGNGRTPGRTGIVLNNARGVRIGKKGSDNLGRRVERLGDRQGEGVVTGLSGVSFVAGPTEIPQDPVGWVRDHVDLLPSAPAYVSDPELVIRARAKIDSKRVAQPVSDDPASIRIRIAAERVRGQSGTGRCVNADYRSIERHGVAVRPQVLTTQRSPFA